MNNGTVPAIFTLILLLSAPFMASAMTNIPAEPKKKGTTIPEQVVTPLRNVPAGSTKVEVQDAIKKDSNKHENIRSK